jgi:hypothetical protein
MYRGDTPYIKKKRGKTMEHFRGTMVRARTGKDPLITIWDKPNLQGMCASISDPTLIDTVIEELQKVKIMLDKTANL